MKCLTCDVRRWTNNGMSVTERVREKLTEALNPIELDIVDESAKHAGHAGARPEGETHFHVRIVSARFEGLTRIERQRLVHGVLEDELRTRVHALSLVVSTPAEAGVR